MHFAQKYLKISKLPGMGYKRKHKPIKPFNVWKQILCTHFLLSPHSVCAGGSIHEVHFQFKFAFTSATQIQIVKMLQNESISCVNFKRIAHKLWMKSQSTIFSFAHYFEKGAHTQMHAKLRIQTKPIFAFNFKWLNSLHTFCLYAIIMQDKQIWLQNFKSISFDKKQSSSYTQNSSSFFECDTKLNNHTLLHSLMHSRIWFMA